MSTLYRYRVFCNTSGTYEYTDYIDESKGAPTTCPANPVGHTIDQSKTTIVEKVDPTQIGIKEEEVPTGGHFKVIQLKFSNPANTTTNHIFSWKIPLNVKATAIPFEEIHRADRMTLAVAPNTIIGAITAHVVANDTIINVSPTVLTYIAVGFKVSLFDGVNTDNLGMVLAVDKVNSRITVETPATQAFSAFSPTYVRMSVVYADDIEITPFTFDAGKDTMGTTYVPANTVIHFTYTNNHPTVAKDVFIYISAFY